METFEAAAQAFLAEPRIAVAGVSRAGNAPANYILKKLRATGHEAFAVNPNADEVDGEPCYPDLASIPGGVTAVVLATHPDVTLALARTCAAAGVRRVWMHRSLGQGSASAEAEAVCREQGLDVIAGGCPLMFLEPVDVAHKCLRWYVGRSGRWEHAAV